MDLQELVATTENLTDDCQRVLKDTLKEIFFRQKGPAKLKPCAELDCIVNVGILVHDNDRYAVQDAAKKKIRKLYTYLLRKFDVDVYWNLDTGKEETVPKGAEFVSEISIDGEIKSSIQFPDDEITALLNLFGVNRCDNWPL